MESHIMVDVERLEAIVGSWHCTFTKQDGKVAAWALSKDCAYKFLVVNGRLIIGSINDHGMVYAAWILRDEPLAADIRERAEAINFKQYHERNWSVSGAGIIGVDGKITSWESKCFRVETPVERREEIAREIERLFCSGALTPR